LFSGLRVKGTYVCPSFLRTGQCTDTMLQDTALILFTFFPHYLYIRIIHVLN
jgi:hypothetical protein